MKNLLISFLFLLASSSSFSQQTTYEGPAKMYVNFYFRDVKAAKESIEAKSFNSAKMKVTSLERSVSQIQTKDPSYDTKSMVDEIALLKELIVKGEQTSQQDLKDMRQAEWNAVQDGHDLEYLFKEANLQVGHNNLEFAQKRLDEFKARTQKVLVNIKSPDPDYIRYISRFNATMDQFYSRNKSLLSDINNVEEYKPAFMELQLYEAYWDAARQIYPNESEFIEAYTKIVAYRKSIGSLDDVGSVAEKNTADKIASRKMESPVVKDIALEKFVMDAFNATFQKNYGKALKVVLIQNGWTTEYNQLTGVVVGRHTQSQVAYKGADGKCYLLSGIMYIHEDYTGNGYGSRKIVYDGLGGQEMLCENVK